MKYFGLLFLFIILIPVFYDIGCFLIRAFKNFLTTMIGDNDERMS